MNTDIDITGVVLHTKRLTLRPFELGDLEDFYEYCKVPGVGEMAGLPHHKSIEDSKFVLNMFLEGKKTSLLFMMIRLLVVSELKNTTRNSFPS